MHESSANLVFETLWRHVSNNVFDTFLHIVRELFRESDISTGDSEICMTFVSVVWMSLFDLPALDYFIEEANRVAQRGQRVENKYVQRIFAKLGYGHTKKLWYSVFMIKETHGRENHWFGGLGGSFATFRAARDVEETEVAFVQNLEVTTTFRTKGAGLWVASV